MFKIISICKGGGYMYAKTIPLHPKSNSNGLYPLHRIIVENLINRLLSDKEIVHHKDGNRYNNNADNLEILTRSEHSFYHSKKVTEIICTCVYCGKTIILKPHLYRLRLKRAKNGITCSYSCSAKLFHKSIPKVGGSSPSLATNE